MQTQKRDLSQELETLLSGRSILDLTGEESVKSIVLLTEIIKSKSLKSLSKIELQALVEELVEVIATNMFNTEEPNDWKKQLLDKIKNCNERELGWSYSSIFDFYLHNVKLWNVLDVEDSEILANTILKYLEDKDYYDYFIGYIEEYLDEEEKDR